MSIIQEIVNVLVNYCREGHKVSVVVTNTGVIDISSPTLAATREAFGKLNEVTYKKYHIIVTFSFSSYDNLDKLLRSHSPDKIAVSMDLNKCLEENPDLNSCSDNITSLILESTNDGQIILERNRR